MIIHSYSSIYALGHKALEDLFKDPVLVEEKVDGSQISFGKFDGELFARSKGQELRFAYPEGMFLKAIEVIKTLDLKDGWSYRGEYLAKPKHNTLSYSRTPVNNIIIFDIDTGDQCYMSYADKKKESERLGLECVPLLYEGIVDSPEFVKSFLEKESILGGTKIEGVVIKNYSRFGGDKKILMGKYVSEAFKEKHSTEWKASNLAGRDIIDKLIATYKIPARWQKAVQHLKEKGLLENSPKDIGLLFKEVHEDIRKECEDEIKTKLYEWAIAKVCRGACAGMPEWYKEELLKSQFGGEK